MRLRSFTAVVIRIIGMMTIVYGIVTMIFVLIAFSMMPGMDSEFPGVRSMMWMQLALPVLMCSIGVLLIAVSTPLSRTLCSGLED